MLDSKDYVIKMFKEEIERKNQLIRELLEKQEYLETRLQKIEAVLLFDDDDLEAQSGVKKEEDIDIVEESNLEKGESLVSPSILKDTMVSEGSGNDTSNARIKEELD